MIKSVIFLGCLVLGMSVPALADLTVNGDGGSDPSTSGQMKEACQIAGSMRLTIDSMKGNCQPAQESKGGALPDDTGDCTSPNSPDSSATSSGAADACTYKLGARPNLSGPIDNPDPGGSTDCSGLVSAGLCRAGTSFEPNSDCKDLTTAAMFQDVTSGKSCFEPIPAGQQPNLKPGDLVIYQHAKGGIGHVFEINTVDKSSCNTFSIIQAADKKDGVGVFLANGSSSVSGDQGEALKAASGVNCGGASQAGDKIKIVRFNPQHSGCQLKQGKKLANEGAVKNCDVGSMSD